jgi:hypothetical protein
MNHDISPLKLSVVADTKIPSDSCSIADFLEKMAASIRNGDDDTVAIHIINIDAKGGFRDRAIGSIFTSTLIGYLVRTVNMLAKEIDG